MLDEFEARGDVEVERLLEVGSGRLEERPRARAPRVVDDDVETTHLGDRPLDHERDRGQVRDVARNS
jgi:hypothetical protein